MKVEVKIAKSDQAAIPETGKKASTLYYVVIGEGKDKVVIGIGEKNYKGLEKLIPKN